MSQENIIRAWKDESFRNGLGETERSLLPAHPSGLIEISDSDLGVVVGMRFTCGGKCDPTDCFLPNTKGQCCGEGGGGGGGGGGGCGMGTAACTQQVPCC